MRSARLRRRRARAQSAIRVALAGAVLVGSGAAAGVAGYLAAATDAGTRTTLADASRDAPLAFEVSSTGGEPEQVDAALSEQLAGIDVPHDVHRSQISGSRVVFPRPDGPPTIEDEPAEGDEDSGIGHLVLAAYEGLTEHAELVAGDWPGTPPGAVAHPVAIHAAPAAELDIAVGDVISFSDRGDAVALDVVGLWRPLDADSPFWFEAREADGAAGSTDLVGVMSEAGLEAVPGLTLTSRWRIVPDLDQMEARDVATLEAALPPIRPSLERDDRTSGARVETDRGILAVLSDSEDKRRAARGLTAAPMLLLAVAGVLAVALLGRLLVVARSTETSVYRARGASAAQVFVWSLTEALAVVVLPSVAGAAGAWLVLSLVAGISAPPTVLATAAGVAAAIAVATLVAVGTRPVLGPPTAVREQSNSGRRVGAAQLATAIVAAVLAVVTMWQLLRYGGPAVEDARGGMSVDPLAATAPVAALAAAGLLVTAGVALGARAAQALVARRRTLGSVLAVRSVARRPARYAVPITLVVLAAGSGTLAAGLSGTWADLQRDAAAQRAGADLQVVLAPRPVTAATPPDGAALEPYRQIDGAESVTPVLSGSVQLGGEPVQFAAFPAGRPSFEGAQLPPAADSVELVFTATMTAHELDFGVVGEPGDEPAPGQVRIQLLLADADGLVSAVRAGELAIPASATPSRHVVRAELPAGTAPWTLVGLDLSLAADGATGQLVWVNDYAITLAQVSSFRGEIAHEVRRPATWSLGFVGDPPRLTGEVFTVEQPDSRPGMVVTSGGFPYPSFDVRLLAGEWSIGNDAAAPVAVQATEAALERSGLAAGDRATARIAGAELQIEVVGVEADMAGMTTDEVLVADLNEVTAAALASAGSVPRANQVWIDASSADVAGELVAGARPVAGPRAEIIDRVALEADLRANAFARMSLVTYWVVTGAVVLLAGIGLAAAGNVLVRERAAEVGVLRALGASSKVQAKVGRREQLVIFGLALLLGATAGGLVTVLVAGLLAAAATPIQLYGVEPVLRLQILPWAAVLGVLAASAVAAAVSYGERLRRRATGPPSRGFGT